VSPRSEKPSAREDGLVRGVIRFSGFLKQHGFKVFPSTVAESLHALEALDLSDPRSLHCALRATLVHSDLEWRLFDDLYEAFWCGEGARVTAGEPRPEDPSPDRAPEDPVRRIALETESREGDRSEAREEEAFRLEGAVFSPVPSFEKKEFDRLRAEDLRFARLALRNMIAPFRYAASRRTRPSRRFRDVDFRRTFRESLKTGGTPVRLFHRKRRKRLRRLVVLADVSGSMDRHVRFVLPFLMGIKGSGVRAEVFVFSTSLSPLTPLLRRHAVEEVLDRLSEAAPDWSGGTRIGPSLRQFNREHGEGLLNRRSVVVILSDGWDLGAKEMLRREMAEIHAKAGCVVWLNPVAGDPDVQTLCRGMRTALPYIHHVLPADSLRGLMRAGHVLAGVLRNR
jgi:hypothetical protein